MEKIFELPPREGNIGDVQISLKIKEKDRGFEATIQSYLNDKLLGTDFYQYSVPEGEESKDIKEIMGEISDKFSKHFEKADSLGC